MLTVVSSLADRDYGLYGRNFVETFHKNWSEDVKIIMYLDRADSEVHHDVEALLKAGGRRDFTLFPLSDVPSLYRTIDMYKHLPNMNGTLHGDYSMRWDGVKFTYKVFSFCHAALNLNKSRYLLWLDADTVTHASLDSATVTSLLQKGDVVAWLNRNSNYPECGFLLFDTEHPRFKDVVNLMLTYYTTGKICELEQTHDSWVWWQVIEKDLHLPVTELSGEYANCNHPFINVLGKWLDHLKGPLRKERGKSLPKDIKTTRSEQWWGDLQ